MRTKPVSLLLALLVALTGTGSGQETATPKPEEAARSKSEWTDFSWLTKWFKSSEKGQAPAAPGTSTTLEETGIRVTAEDLKRWENWLTKQWNGAGQLPQELKDQLAKVDWETVGIQFKATIEALEKGDYAEAEKLALAMDATLGTHALKEYVPILKAWVEQGMEGASTAIRTYLNRPDISEVEKKAYEGLLVSLETMERDDVKGYVSLGVVFACRHQFGSPQGELVGGLIVTGLYGEAGGTKGLVQWAKESLKGALEKKPMP
jgi:hypothetical protein